MLKQTGIVLRSYVPQPQKEATINTCNRVNGPRKRYSESNEPCIKVCVLYNYPREILEQMKPIYSRREARTVAASWEAG